MTSFGQFVSRTTGRFLSSLMERDQSVDSLYDLASTKEYKNGELVFAKNNVCVHNTSSTGPVIHIGGYFSLYYKSGRDARSGLLLHWLANETFFDSTCRNELSPLTEEGKLSEEDISNRRRLPRLESQPALSTITQKQNKNLTSFFVDLTTVKRLRFFYTDSFQSAGAFLVVSRENQSKVFHFHTGGLDRLANVMEQFCALFEEPKSTRRSSILSSIQEFTVRKASAFRKEDTVVTQADEVVEPLSKPIWLNYLAENGQVSNESEIRKRIFFKPMHSDIRRYIWPLLLGEYNFDSTYEEREQAENDALVEYHRCNKIRGNMDPEMRDNFMKQVQSTVEKDVVRTDRQNPLFAGANNPNCTILQNILLNIAICEPSIGYTQGMSDLLATFFNVFDSQESAMFSIFRRFLQTPIFVSPKDRTIDEQLNFTRRLVQMFVPNFYGHLLRTGDSIDLLFCHRWILLFFKREFKEDDLLRIWDCCFACPDTAYFHLFVALAIIAVYGNYPVKEKLAYDETLLYFNELAMNMNGDEVLLKARQFLRQFRRMDRIPCTLYPLVQSANSTGQWDCASLPAVQCSGDHLNQRCPYDVLVAGAGVSMAS